MLLALQKSMERQKLFRTIADLISYRYEVVQNSANLQKYFNCVVVVVVVVVVVDVDDDVIDVAVVAVYSRRQLIRHGPQWETIPILWDQAAKIYSEKVRCVPVCLLVSLFVVILYY